MKADRTVVSANGTNSSRSRARNGNGNGFSKDIGQLMRDGKQIDRAGKRAVRAALHEHKLLGHRVVVWRNGKVVWLKPEEI